LIRIYIWLPVFKLTVIRSDTELLPLHLLFQRLFQSFAW